MGEIEKAINKGLMREIKKKKGTLLQRNQSFSKKIDYDEL